MKARAFTCSSIVLLGTLPLALAAPAGAAARPSFTKLSDERLVTYTAHAVARAPVRRNHDGHSSGIVRLHYDTEDHFREVYLVLARWDDGHGHRWLKIRLPMRP